LVRVGGAAALAAAAAVGTTRPAAAAPPRQSVLVVPTITELSSTNRRDAGAVVVTDPNRGGVFTPSDGRPDSTLHFDAKDIGTWARQADTDLHTTWAELDETGATDASADINQLIRDAIANNVDRIVFNRDATYLLTDTIDLSDIHDLTLDFNGATIKDNVQGTIPESAQRGKHTFYIHGSSNITVRNLQYRCEPTRSHHVANVPTVLFWVGTNYGANPQETSGITIENIHIQNAIPSGMVVAVLGETWNCTFRRIEVHGNWTFGIDIEYGLAPKEDNLFGRHPHNILVENFNGYDNPVCEGFLRVASCYNIKFLNCEGRNVKAFIYCYSGDRNISRYGENVVFENCNHYADTTFTTAVNYVVWIVVVNLDGSTGEPLPAFTNYDHMFAFNNCEFQNNATEFSACVRLFGTLGHVRLSTCTLSNSWYGIRTGGSVSSNYLSPTALTVQDSLFKNNHQDVWLDRIEGVRLDSCHFRDGVGALPSVAITAAPRNVLTHNRFDTTRGAGPYVTIDGDSARNQVRGNVFLGNSGAAIETAALTLGSDNTADTALTTAARGVLGESSTLVRTLSASDQVVDADAHRMFTATSTGATIAGIGGGEAGVIVTVSSLDPDATITVKHDDASVPPEQRLLLVSGADLTVAGNESIQLINLGGRWRQL